MHKTLLAIFLFTCCSFYIPQDSAITVDKMVIKTAESQLNQMLAKIPPGHDSDYGFNVNENLENCETGRLYRLMLLNEDFYTADIEDDVSYLEIKNEWRVPVRLSGTDRVLLTVSGNPGNFTVSEIGGTDLAKELEAKRMIADKDDNLYILRIPPLSADFLIAEHESSFADAKFFPLPSAIAAIPMLAKNKKKWYTLEEVQHDVKDAIKNLPVKKPAKKVTPVKNKSKKIKLQSQ